MCAKRDIPTSGPDSDVVDPVMEKDDGKLSGRLGPCVSKRRRIDRSLISLLDLKDKLVRKSNKKQSVGPASIS